MRSIKLNYDRLPQASFIEKIGFIIFCLTGNPNFLALPVALADLKAKKEAYEAKLDKSKQGDHVATEEAKALDVEIGGIIRKNGHYIIEQAAGDVAKLESSGYDLTKVREYAPVPEVRVMQGDKPGEGKIVIEAVKGALAYLVFFCLDPMPNPFDELKCKRLHLSSKHYLPISGIESGKLYWLVYYTVSKDGESAVSRPFSFRLN
jgi:hypothetical protein